MTKKDVLIRGLPTDLHHRLKVQCAVENVTMKDKIIQLIENATANTNIQGTSADPHALKAGSATK